MTDLTKYERESTFKTRTHWISGSTDIDPSGQKSYLSVWKADGTKLLDDVECTRSALGYYHYYVSTNSVDPLGIYIVDHWGWFGYGSPWEYMPKHNKECIQLVKVKQA